MTDEMTAAKLTLVAKAEKILNGTLAYQAAIAVHDLKDRLDLSVAELRLVVAPETPEAAGCYRVTCTIASLATPRRLTTKITGANREKQGSPPTRHRSPR